ncbi:hypothetical protein FB45DRAFT_925813 [Roridomyces roridus]|uniref:Uncharacterized protein n=1 Tax=Roridomyces roridus TaxID=1738132 RepID=A0AAD7BKD2_9AGAR|nr:hypothetical protein FB45DRAFT_925813 [Roridomyces roridus]
MDAGVAPIRRAAKTVIQPIAIYFESPSALGSWFAKNHAKENELWVGYFKKHTGRQGLSISTATDEALCWGWINGLMKSVDDDRHMQRFTPRKGKSHWSKVNVDKVALLEAAGRMQESGRAAFAQRTEANTAQMCFEREEGAMALSKEFRRKLKEVAAAAEWHDGQPPGYRRDAEDWVMSAKQEATRERRLATLIENAEKGLRIPPLRR